MRDAFSVADMRDVGTSHAISFYERENYSQDIFFSVEDELIDITTNTSNQQEGR